MISLKKHFKTLLTLTVFCFVTSEAVSQTLVPATTEDIEQFDLQMAEQIKKAKAAQPQATPSAQFGAAVAEEAKKLKDSSADQKKEFGAWVKDQRRKSETGRSAEGGRTKGANSADGESIAPGANGRGRNKKPN